MSDSSGFDDSDSSGFKFADEDIIDDMGITAEFDKVSVPGVGMNKWKEVKCKTNPKKKCKEPDGKWSKKEVKEFYDEVKGKFGPKWKKYEGCMTSKGMDAACVNKNEGGGKSKGIDMDFVSGIKSDLSKKKGPNLNSPLLKKALRNIENWEW